MFRNLSLSSKLTFVIVSVTFLTLAIYFSIATWIERNQAMINLSEQTTAMARIAGEYCVSDLVFGYKDEAQADLSKLFLQPDVQEALIFDKDGELFASQFNLTFQHASHSHSIENIENTQIKVFPDRIEIYQPMTYRGKAHGTLFLVRSMMFFHQAFRARFFGLLIIWTIILLLSFFIARVFQRWISLPILNLTSQAQQIADGDLSRRVSVPENNDEIAILCQNVNQMADSLENRVKEVEQARQLLQLITDNIPVGVFLKNRNSVYEWANQFFLEFAGFSGPDEIVGKTDADLPWKPDETEFFIKCDQRVMESDNPEFHIIEPIRRADGSEIWLDTSKVPMHDNEGNVTGILGSFMDITRRKLAEEAMKELTLEQKEAAAKFQALIGASNSGAWEYDNQTEYAWCSPEYFSMLGYDKKDFNVSGKNLDNVWLDLIHPGDRDRAKNNFIEYLKDPHGMYQQTFRMKHNDGHWVWIWSRGTTLVDADGNPTNKTLGAHIDITDRIMLEERLRQSDKLEAIGQLAGGVAHDFNNQLGGILGSAELLMIKMTDPKLKSMAGNIVKAATRSAELTQQLLAFARKGKFITTPVNIHELIDEVVMLLQHSLDRRIEIKRRLGASFPVVIGDATQLQNSFLNLAINARDAMPNGGELTFTTSIVEIDAPVQGVELPPGKYLRISVTDTGVGISPENQAHLFEPFFTTKKPGQGTGLGLAAVYGAVKNHGGIINVYSEMGKGTTFSVYLPLAQNSDADLLRDTTVATPHRGEGCILLIDDEEVIRCSQKEMLQSLGYQVLTCNNGEEAIELYKLHWKEIDLVILDMIMPRMNGEETFSELRKLNPRVKVLISSGFTVNGSATRLLEKGALGFVQKPAQVFELSKKINEILKMDVKKEI